MQTEKGGGGIRGRGNIQQEQGKRRERRLRKVTKGERERVTNLSEEGRKGETRGQVYRG